MVARITQIGPGGGFSINTIGIDHIVESKLTATIETKDSMEGQMAGATEDKIVDMELTIILDTGSEESFDTDDGDFTYEIIDGMKSILKTKKMSEFEEKLATVLL